MHKIGLDINTVGRGSVKLDGKELTCLGISIRSRAGRPSIVRLTLLADVSGTVDVEEWSSVPKGTPGAGSDVTSMNDKYARYACGGTLTPNEAREAAE